MEQIKKRVSNLTDKIIQFEGVLFWMIPADLLGRWAKHSKVGKRALQSYSTSETAKAHDKLREAVAGLLLVCDEMTEWLERDGRAPPAARALVQVFCDEAAFRQELCLGLGASNVAVAVVAWRLEPFLNGPAAEQVKPTENFVCFVLRCLTAAKNRLVRRWPCMLSSAI